MRKVMVRTRERKLSSLIFVRVSTLIKDAKILSRIAWNKLVSKHQTLSEMNSYVTINFFFTDGLEEDRAAKGYKKYLEDIKAKHG